MESLYKVQTVLPIWNWAIKSGLNSLFYRRVVSRYVQGFIVIEFLIDEVM